MMRRLLPDAVLHRRYRKRERSGRWTPSPSGRSAARMTLGREFPTLALSICEAGA
jgi:hypothetical protein